jgi:tripartite-type tricarboxylate transporter receptor subunit TctC
LLLSTSLARADFNSSRLWVNAGFYSAHFDTDKALLARARQQPDAPRWATSGSGWLGHLMLENIRASVQVRITHVP